MKVLTAGSRNWEGIWGEWRVQTVLSRLLLTAAALDSPLRLMNGACPQGADAIVKRWADRRLVPLDEFPAEWLKYGKRAGPIRNEYMVSLGADMCVAFLRDGSKGTQGTIDLARAAKIPTFPIPWSPADLAQALADSPGPFDDLPLDT